MKAKYIRSYMKPKGPVFVYALSGTQAEIEAYGKAQGDNLRTDEKTGAPLLFVTRFGGNNADIVVTQKGDYILDMSKFRQAASLANQFDGKLGDAIANQAAAQLLGAAFSNTPATVTADAPSEIEGAGK